jgi:hypothetical protein
MTFMTEQGKRSRWSWILLGALLGACVPFISHSISGTQLHPDDIRAGYGALSVTVHAGYGALAAWALAALVNYLRGPRR